jgi:hypothetical protein
MADQRVGTQCMLESKKGSLAGSGPGKQDQLHWETENAHI